MINRSKYLPPHILALVWLLFWAIPTLAAPPQQGEDISVITAPASSAVVQGQVDIIGSSDHPSFQFYVLEFAPEPVTNNQWQTIGEPRTTAVNNGLLATWDTTAIPDGSYTLRLRTVRLDGNYTEGFSQQVVVANAQPVPTDTPAPNPDSDSDEPTPDASDASAVPTETPTALPPTPTINIEQPIVETPTPRPVPTSAPLPTPDQNDNLFDVRVTGFSPTSFWSACLYGGGIMLGVFVLFGFLSALRVFVRGFMDRTRKK